MASPSIGWLGWLPVRFSITWKSKSIKNGFPHGNRSHKMSRHSGTWGNDPGRLEGSDDVPFHWVILGSMLIYRGGVDDGLGFWGFYTVWVILRFFL